MKSSIHKFLISMYYTLKTSNLSITIKDAEMNDTVVETSVILDIRTPPSALKPNILNKQPMIKLGTRWYDQAKKCKINTSANIRINTDEVGDAFL